MKERSIFAKRLRQERKKKPGLSQETMSELCGFYKNTIGKYERGEAIPSADSLCQIADYLGVSTDYLLGRDGDKKI